MQSYCLLLLAFLSFLSSANQEVPGLEIVEIETGVFLHTSYNHVNGFGLVSSNGLVVVNEGSAFVVDTPWSSHDTEKLAKWIRLNGYDLLGGVATHSHDDRTAGIKWLNDNSIATYATALTNKILRQEGKEQAKYSVDGTGFELVDELLEIFYPGGGHTIDNVVVWLPKSKILFGGCFVRSLESKGLGYTGEAHIDQWPSSVDKTIAKYQEANAVIPGHGKIGDIELLRHTKYLAEKASIKSP